MVPKFFLLIVACLFYTIEPVSAFTSKKPFENPDGTKDIKKLCEDIDAAIAEYHWDIQACPWDLLKEDGKSVEGRPLVYSDFGDPNAENVTLIFSMVHGDEVTPIYLGLKLLHWLRENIKRFPSTRVVFAPVVNPDGFFRKPSTRVNARGVDLNRNFSTEDWKTHALVAWKTEFHANERRYPGAAPDSEPETLFQKALIDRVKPQKILSVHAPLNFMDYDGPNVLTLAKFPREYVKKCLQLRSRVKAVSGGFYPGSLGNYAGQERGIPTFTLELPSAGHKKASGYWKQFQSGIERVIQFKVPDYAFQNFEKTQRPIKSAQNEGAGN